MCHGSSQNKEKQIILESGRGAGGVSDLLMPPVGFTSDRFGEVCVFWEPRCDIDCDRPAKAARSFCRGKIFKNVRKKERINLKTSLPK